MYVYVPLLMLPAMAFHSYDCHLCYNTRLPLSRPRPNKLPHRSKIALGICLYSFEWGMSLKASLEFWGKTCKVCLLFSPEHDHS